MLKKILTILLSLLFVVYASFQAKGVHAATPAANSIRVLPKVDQSIDAGRNVNGKIQLTAAFHEMQETEMALIRFVLYSDLYTYRASVVVTPESQGEGEMLTASVCFENLLSGVYTAQIEYISNACPDYILVENGDQSEFVINEESVTFCISENANTGSAWFVLEEKAGDTL